MLINAQLRPNGAPLNAEAGVFDKRGYIINTCASLALRLDEFQY